MKSLHFQLKNFLFQAVVFGAVLVGFLVCSLHIEAKLGVRGAPIHPVPVGTKCASTCIDHESTTPLIISQRAHETPRIFESNSTLVAVVLNMVALADLKQLQIEFPTRRSLARIYIHNNALRI
jgi:hypothetical protein